MNCDECKERVFELIEEEATDPRKVREVLEACPECRALFEQMKAGLDIAAELPIEEPPARLDAAILEAAAQRRPGEVPRRSSRRLVRTSPWAMAAVALLAIGIGVWAVPRDVQLDEERSPAVRLQGVDRATESASEPPLDGTADALKSSGPTFSEGREAAVEPARRRSAPGSVAQSPAAEKQRPSVVRKTRETFRPKTQPSQPADDEYQATPAMTLQSEELAAGITADRDEQEERARDREMCDRLIRQYERTKKPDTRLELDSEQQLKLGRCYAEAGRIETARAFLKRAAEDVTTKNRAEAELRRLDRGGD